MEGMPVFVKINEYKDILEVMGLIKNRLDQAKKTIGKITKLKNSEDAQLDSWKENLADVERKIDMIDSVLFEPQSL
jgi:peptidoglycan hydrolase CwlO-like protein